MSYGNREAAIKITLKYEGGYTNDPRDPGLATNWGITIHDARLYWKPDATNEDVRNMPLDVAVEIYRKQYWNKMACDLDPDGVDLVTFDYGVNSGVGRAVPCRTKFKNTDSVKWVQDICKERLRFLHNLKTWSVFGKGWGSRVADVEARGVKMAMKGHGATQAEVTATLNKEAKAAQTKSREAGIGAVATGASGGAVAPSSTQLPDPTVVPLGGKIAVAVVCVVLISIAAVCVWHWWQNRQRAQAYLKVAKEP